MKIRSVYHINRTKAIQILIIKFTIITSLIFKRSIATSDKNEKKKITKDGKIDFRSGQPRLIQQLSKNQKTDSGSKSAEAKKQITPDSSVSINDIKSINIISIPYKLRTLLYLN